MFLLLNDTTSQANATLFRVLSFHQEREMITLRVKHQRVNLNLNHFSLCQVAGWISWRTCGTVCSCPSTLVSTNYPFHSPQSISPPRTNSFILCFWKDTHICECKKVLVSAAIMPCTPFFSLILVLIWREAVKKNPSIMKYVSMSIHKVWLHYPWLGVSIFTSKKRTKHTHSHICCGFYTTGLTCSIYLSF